LVAEQDETEVLEKGWGYYTGFLCLTFFFLKESKDPFTRRFPPEKKFLSKKEAKWQKKIFFLFPPGFMTLLRMTCGSSLLVF
jgi:hypothetical protein